MNIKSAFIRKRNDNYNVYIEYIDEEGKTKQKSQGKYNNKKDAERHLIDLKSSINNNRYIIPKDITLVDRCYMYIEDNKREWSPHTIKNRTMWTKNQIHDFFKDTLLFDVKPYQLQAFCNNLSEKFSLESFKVRIGFLRAVLRESYRLREIPENPFDFVKLSSKKDAFKADVYTRDEVRLIIDKLDGELFELPILLMILLGLRFAEACGLRWSDIDFDNNIININQIIVYQGKEGFIFKNPKTKGSKRSIHAPIEIMEKFKKEKLRQNKFKLQGVLDNSQDLVCLNSNLDPWLNSTLYSNFSRFLKKHNIRRLRLHDLRHTNATMMLLGGIDIKTVSERLGHTDIKISMNKYSHVLKEMDQKASNKLSKMLFK